MQIAKQRSAQNTFGWVRAEILGALVNAVFLLALSFTIFVEAVKRLIDTELVEQPELILVVGIIGLLINIVGIFLFHSHATMGGGHGHSHGSKKSVEEVAAPIAATDNQLDGDRLRESFSIVAVGAHSVSVLDDVAAMRFEEDGEDMIRGTGDANVGAQERERLTSPAKTRTVDTAVNSDKAVKKQKAHGHSRGCSLGYSLSLQTMRAS